MLILPAYQRGSLPRLSLNTEVLKGKFILRGASRLDAFSVYPFHT